MPDPLHIFFSTTALLYISIWLTKRRPTNLLTASFFLALTFLTKPYSLVLLLPVLIIILVNNYPTKYIKNTSIILFFILSLLPYILWKIHIDHYPQGQFDTDWLFNSTAIRFKPAFFRWIFYERFSNLILGSGGFVLLILGFISPKSPKESLFYYSWLVSLLVFVTIIATGNITHDYYQLPFIPLFSILVAKGIVYLLIIGKNFYQKIFNFSIACFLFIMMLSIGWYNTQGFFNVNNWSIVKAGQAADQIIPANGLVIAPYNRDPAFLYQTNRYGWTQPVEDIDKLINTYPNPIYLVSTTKDDYTAKVVSVGQVVDETQEYIIVKIK